MALKPELQTWLDQVKDSLSKETRERLEQDLATEAAATKFKDTILARSDYSRAMDQLRAEEQKLKAEADKSTQEATALIGANKKWREDNVKAYETAIKERETAFAELEAHRARIKVLAEQGLIDPEDPTLAVAAQVKPKDDGGNGKGTNYLTQEALMEALAKKDAELVSAIANFEDLADEHFQLTGQRLKRADFMQAMIKNPNKTMYQVWEEGYGITQKRKELEEASIQRRIDEARAEERAKVLSERATDALNPNPASLSRGDDKHIISLFTSDKNNARQTGRTPGVAEAVASWERGEFRPKTPA